MGLYRNTADHRGTILVAKDRQATRYQARSISDNRMQNEIEKKGTKTKLFGVGLIFLGALDSMLFWRGGLVVNDFYLLLFVLGCVIYIFGAIRGSSTQADLKR